MNLFWHIYAPDTSLSPRFLPRTDSFSWLQKYEMSSFLRTFDTTNILKIVNLLRPDTASASFLFDTAEKPFSGGQCLIYAIGFPDGITWTVRIPARVSYLPLETISDEVNNEVSILKHLETKGFSWSPRTIDYDCSFNNVLEYPYKILTWVHGKPLEWSDSVPARREDRKKIINQMTDIILELAESTKETCEFSLEILPCNILTDHAFSFYHRTQVSNG